MDRKDFLTALGYTSGALLFTSCLAGCSKSAVSNPTPTSTPPPEPVNFKLDLSLPANSALNTPGGYVYSKGVIVAKTAAGPLIAVAQACTHQGTSVQYVNDKNQFYCPNHGSNFNDSGAVINGPANAPLKQYKVTVASNIVTVKE